MSWLLPCRLLVSKYLPATLIQTKPYNLILRRRDTSKRLGVLSNICEIHSFGPRYLKYAGKKDKGKKPTKDTAQNEVDAILSTQAAAKIESFAVQLLDESDLDLGIMKKRLAQQRADDDNLNLVCIDDKQRPNVYKLMTSADHVIFDKEQKKLRKETSKRDQKTIRLKMGISARDLETKLKHGDEWIDQGHSIFVSLKAARGMSTEDMASAQAKIFAEITKHFEGKVIVKQASKTDTDLKVLLTPNPPS